MRNRWALMIAFAVAVGWTATSRAGDWIFDSGPYTRDPDSGKRVAQYEPLPQVNRIPFREFFSEDGPHPFGMDWWYGNPYWYGGGYTGFEYGLSPYGWGGYPSMGPVVYPLGTP